MADIISTEKATRWQQIKQIWQDYVIEYGILAIVAFLMLGFWIFGDNLFNMLDTRLGYVTNVFTELLSIVITVFVLNRLNIRRQDKQELTRLKALLASKEAGVTKIATAELNVKGWLKDGSLKGANLWSANLAGENLEGANLAGANLKDANLEGTNLIRANLAGANLSGANLKGAKLVSANLSSTRLQYANLENAMLWYIDLKAAYLFHTNLKGANLIKGKLEGVRLITSILTGATLIDCNLEFAELRNSILEGAKFTGVVCNGVTLLPNGERWTEDVDWSEFGAVVRSTTDE